MPCAYDAETIVGSFDIDRETRQHFIVDTTDVNNNWKDTLMDAWNNIFYGANDDDDDSVTEDYWSIIQKCIFVFIGVLLRKFTLRVSTTHFLPFFLQCVWWRSLCGK